MKPGQHGSTCTSMYTCACPAHAACHAACHAVILPEHPRSKLKMRQIPFPTAGNSVTYNYEYPGNWTTPQFRSVIMAPIQMVIHYTSSTAQGGGGSFKNRKPIGEVGGCESRMAERAKPLMDRKVLEVSSLSLSFSDYLSIYISIYLCIYLSICLSIYLCIYLSIYVSIYLSIYLSTYLPTYLPIYLSTYLSTYLSICLAIYLSISSTQLASLSLPLSPSFI